MADHYNKQEYIFLEGFFKWVRWETPDQEYRKYNAVIYPTPESLEIVRDLQSEGIKNVVKKDDDGYYVAFGRPHAKERKGRPDIIFGPVKLFDGTKKREDGSFEEFPSGTQVGNGSTGIMKLEVYEHPVPGGNNRKAKAARLVSIRIDELIPYSKASMSDGELHAQEGMDKVKRNLF